jgi:hypothetical protein
MYASPPDNGCSMASMLNVELFPAPLGPKSPSIEPYFTPKVFPQTASKPLGYVLTIYFAAIGQLLPT